MRMFLSVILTNELSIQLLMGYESVLQLHDAH